MGCENEYRLKAITDALNENARIERRQTLEDAIRRIEAAHEAWAKAEPGSEPVDALEILWGMIEEGGGMMRDIDCKFATTATGAILKKSNGEKIPTEEPLFLLRARDRLAIPLLKIYRILSALDGCNDYHFQLLDADIELFEKFKAKHPERMKQPSITRGV